MPSETDDIADKLDVEFAPYDAEAAEEALEALAEFLVAVWLQRRGEGPDDRKFSALPGN